MARNCIEYCPHIQGIVDKIKLDNHISGALPIHPDIWSNEQLRLLLMAAQNTYNCPGPTSAGKVTRKRFLRNPVEVERVFCPQHNIFADKKSNLKNNKLL